MAAPVDNIAKDRVRGIVTMGHIDESAKQWSLQNAIPPDHNDLLYSWATIFQRLLRNAKDGKNYYIGGMYVEFDNSGSAVNPTPTISRSDDLSYYTTLSSPRDYLRVPIVLLGEENSDSNTFVDNNTAVFHAKTSGVVGVNGLPFSAAANSRVYGGALVAFCDPADATKDLIFSRYYAAAANQLLKEVGRQIGLEWRIVGE